MKPADVIQLKKTMDQGAKGPGGLKARLDGWVNLLTGLGTGRDKTTASEFSGRDPLTYQEASDLFHFDDMANRICCAVPDDAMRQGFGVTRTVEEKSGGDAEVGEVQNDSQALNKKLTELEVAEKVRKAAIWGRTFGAGVILLGVEGAGKPDKPLDESKARGVRFLTVLDRADLQPATWYSDPSQPKYGEVETYYLTPQGVAGLFPSMFLSRVHETRLVIFGGALTAKQEKTRNGGWDYSVLQKLVDILRDTHANWGSVVAMMADMSQAVFKIQGLLDMIAEGSKTDMTERMALVDTLRSITRAIVLDADSESFELVERGALTGVGDLLDRTYLRLSAAARMPYTILMGQSPTGLGATGASDLRWWYDTVTTSRELELTPKIKRIVRLVAQGLYPDKDSSAWTVIWPSLWQMTPQEEADLRNKIANTDHIYITDGVLFPEEVTLSRFASGAYSTEYVVDIEARRKMLAAELEEAESPTEAPETTTPPSEEDPQEEVDIEEEAPEETGTKPPAKPVV